MSHDESNMPHIERAKTFVIDLNTILLIFSIVAGIVGGSLFLIRSGRQYESVMNRIEKIEEWKLAHEQVSKDRRGEIEGGLGRISALVTGIDDRLDAAEAGANRLSDRVSATEARNIEMAQTLREMQAAIAEQGGDLKVILAWIEEQRRASQGTVR